MSRGVYPSDVPCYFCHKSVSDVDALWSEGLPYHDHCWKFHLAAELKKYNKKFQLGQITIAEANLMTEIRELYEISKHQPATILVSKLINPETPRFEGNSSLALDTIHRKKLTSQNNFVRICEKNPTSISSGEIEKKLGD